MAARLEAQAGKVKVVALVAPKAKRRMTSNYRGIKVAAKGGTKDEIKARIKTKVKVKVEAETKIDQ